MFAVNPRTLRAIGRSIATLVSVRSSGALPRTGLAVRPLLALHSQRARWFSEGVAAKPDPTEEAKVSLEWCFNLIL
jgi:hypothetical protein